VSGWMRRGVRVATRPNAPLSGIATLRHLGQLLRGLARRLVEMLERRRALAVRRNPRPLNRRLREARNVLVLCQGNVIRSVFAAELLSRELGVSSGVIVRSAGMATQPGWRAHPRVQARCAELDLDVSRHASTAVTAAMVRASDVVLVMEVAHLVAMVRQFPGSRGKTFLLTSLVPELPLEIPDPAGKEDAVVDTCLDQVRRAAEPIIAMLSRGAGTAR
jgi:protein-tyrosine-phosphatase